MKILIIIPVYSEFGTFDRVMERVLQASLPDGCTKEVVVVDDGSTDGTTRSHGDYSRAGVIVGHHSILNFGKGTAVRIGIHLASGDVVLKARP
jgi:glycosyltransferase involved in cell wall biosynthesis